MLIFLLTLSAKFMNVKMSPVIGHVSDGQQLVRSELVCGYTVDIK